MDNRYNLDNLEALFKKYLSAGIEKLPDTTNKLSDEANNIEKKTLKNVSIKNYLSDLRHFLGWLILYLKSHQFPVSLSSQTPLEKQVEMIKIIDVKIIDEYKTYLKENSIPIKTINRRLSTLRKFFSFCISQGWLNENPAKQIQNLKFKRENDQWSFQKKTILNQFKSDLEKENIPQDKVISYLKDIEEFFTIG